MLAMTATSLDFNTAKPQPAAPLLPRRYHEAASLFRTACEEFGLSPGAVVDTDGQIIRYPAQGDKSGKKSGWYIFFDDAIPAGEYGDWRIGESQTWCVKSEHFMSAAELEQHRVQREQARTAREAERIRRAADARERAREKWSKAEDAAAHPYLEKKGVQSIGLKLLGGKLLIPLYDIDGMIHGLQSIDSDGNKRFTFGCEKKGKFFVLPGQDKTAVCEGYATAASVHMATGWTVLVAFDAGNLASAVSVWREAHPNEPMLTCGDADDAGRKGAQTCGLPMLFPPDEGQDWNDVHTREGLHVMRNYLLSQLPHLNGYVISLRDFLQREYVIDPAVDGLFDQSEIVLINARSGTGKGFITTELALDMGSVISRDGVDDFNESLLWGKFRIPKMRRTLFVQTENRNARTQQKIRAMFGKNPGFERALDNVGFYSLDNEDIRSSGSFMNYSFLQKIKSIVLEHKYDNLIFDPLGNFLDVDENDNRQVNASLQRLVDFQKECGATIILVHHIGKSNDRDGRGASAIRAKVDTVIAFERDPKKQIRDQKNIVVLTGYFTKVRHARDGYSVDFTRTDGEFLLRPMPDDMRSAREDEEVNHVIKALEALGGECEDAAVLKKRIAETTGISVKWSERWIAKAREAGVVFLKPKNGRHQGYSLDKTDSEVEEIG
jgi:phage/plasmid primase-like uncharacterized protein/KaiC/GvpD/RAD55 family RecA-like ATPase